MKIRLGETVEFYDRYNGEIIARRTGRVVTIKSDYVIVTTSMLQCALDVSMRDLIAPQLQEKPMSAIINDPTRKGQLAGPTELFGDFHRYLLCPVHTRFDAIAWFVYDAEVTDEVGCPAIIRIEDTREDAMAGLQ